LSLNNLKAKTKNAIYQDILIHHFIFIISSYFQFLSQTDVNSKYKINTSNHLYLTVNEVLFLLLYKTSSNATINEILRILNIAKEELVRIQKNRHYKRVRKMPSSKWSQYGNKYKMSHK
jgi:hypothetical protein